MRLYCDRHISVKSTRRRSRGGFTLLEIMIAVALMLIVTIVVYRGFMASLQYTSNTVQFEKAAQAGVEEVNYDHSSGNSADTNDKGLYLDDGTLDPIVLRVGQVQDSQTPIIVSGEAAFEENDSTSFAASNRKVFYYAIRPCPSCDTGVLLRYADGMKCNNPDCPTNNP
ncbi:MAG: prepilin-type N-terminal cleavage/methylation domain-containing protein [Clostridiales bacterium]|nr:prepilin-type N-terminal cleavage/methylation domain-containing protein [Clostridiales bacterium]